MLHKHLLPLQYYLCYIIYKIIGILLRVSSAQGRIMVNILITTFIICKLDPLNHNLHFNNMLRKFSETQTHIHIHSHTCTVQVDDHVLITWLSYTDHVTDYALITWHSCTDHMADHTLLT